MRPSQIGNGANGESFTRGSPFAALPLVHPESARLAKGAEAARPMLGRRAGPPIPARLHLSPIWSGVIADGLDEGLAIADL